VGQAVEGAPARSEVLGCCSKLLGLGDVDLDDVDRLGELAGGPPGEREPATGSGQDDLGSLFLSDASDTESERRVGEYPGHEDPFPFQ